MNTNFNLCEILKGHEGETFYSTYLGNVKLDSINYTGKVYDHAAKLFVFLLFPSKDQRDWNEWDKENKRKSPKTWSELAKVKDIFTESAEICSNNGEDAS